MSIDTRPKKGIDYGFIQEFLESPYPYIKKRYHVARFSPYHSSNHIPILIDLIERENDFILECELPGAKGEDIHVHVVHNNILHVHVEINEKNYMRKIKLPDNIHKDLITARYKDGLLKIILPKKEKTQRITIV